MSTSATPSIRLSELAAVLSNAGDLAMGQPVAHGLRAAVLAVRLASSAGMTFDTQDAAFYTTLLRWSGCTANAAEFSRFLGDDVRGRAAQQLLEPGQRFAGLTGIASPDDLRAAADEHCEVAQLLASQLGLDAEVVESLGQVFERFDGHGLPRGLSADAISPAAQVAVLAGDTEILVQHLGLSDARERLRSRAGSMYDAELVAIAVGDIAGWHDELARHRDDFWIWALNQEPKTRAPLPASQIDRLAGALADFVDVKVPHLVGHSHRVAEIVVSAARLMGADGVQATLVGRAGLVHDIGRAAIPNQIWERIGRLGPMEQAQEQLHPYYSEQILAPISALREVGAIASLHHERLDGSGYHRQTRAEGLPASARLLAAADEWASLTLDRPWLPALRSTHAAESLRQSARNGRLDPGSVAAVLAVVGEPGSSTIRAHQAGLTEREIEVLGLLVRGLTNAQIATRLHVAPKTVGNHVQNIYGRLGVRSRAAATVAALQLGLFSLNEEDLRPAE